MFYAYRCEKCDKEFDVQQGMMDEHPYTVKCIECGKLLAHRVWGNQAIKIPEHFKAVSETSGGDSYASEENLKKMFTHGKRPSGKTKVYY